MNMPSEYWRYAVAVIIAIVAFTGALWILNRTVKPPAPVSTFSLDQTISDIKTELKNLETGSGAPLGLKLSEVKIALQVSQEEGKNTDASLSVPVFSSAEIKASAGNSWEQGSKVTLVLVPPAESPLLSVPPRSVLKFADLLRGVRESVRTAMQNEPRLDAKSIEVELAFVLVTEDSAGAEVKVELLSLGVGRTQKSTAGNTVTLTYENPAYVAKDAGKPTPP